MIRPCIASMIRLATGLRPQPRPPGLEPPFIWYANHSSHLDFVALWAVLPDTLRDQTSPVAAKDYWGRGPLRRRLVEGFFHGVLISRNERPGRGGNPLALMGAVLERGRSLLLFPEGTRGPGDLIAPFRPGLYHLARRFPAIPLIPVHLENLNRILPKGSFLPVPLIARVAIREPVFLMEGEDKEAFLTRARSTLAESHG